MSRQTRSFMCLSLMALLTIVFFGCAGTMSSGFVHDETYNVNEPVKDPECYDASVLLGVDMERARDIVRKVVAGLDAMIKEERENYIKAKRNRHMGLFVGSGGETLVIELHGIDEEKTFVTATTKTGFVGAVGMKPWSCELVDAMLEMATR